MTDCFLVVVSGIGMSTIHVVTHMTNNSLFRSDITLCKWPISR